jgi:hypothetical protein
MEESEYFREQAARAQRLSHDITDPILQISLRMRRDTSSHFAC